MRKKITVFCGSAEGCPEVYRRAAEEMGRAIARQGRVLVYGSGTCGLMGLTAKGAKEAGGRIVGINAQCFADYLPYPDTDELIMMPDLPSRKQALIEKGDACLALAGGIGILDELMDIYALAQAGLIRKPIGILNTEGYYDGLLLQLNRAFRDHFMPEKDLRRLQVSSEPEALLRMLDAYEEG